MLFEFDQHGRRHKFAIELMKLRVPGIPHPVAFRPDTSDLGTFAQTFLDRDYQLTLAAPPRLIIDGGANVGFVSILFANQFPHARILSVEPMPENFAVLSENARPYPNVQPIHAAIWNRPGQIDLVTHDQNNTFLGHWGIQVREASQTPSNAVRAMTILELLESTGLPFIDILKLDIEGAETEVFNDDAGAWLSKTNMLIIELHDRFKPGCSEKVYAALKPFGFMQFTRAENTFFARTIPLSQ